MVPDVVGDLLPLDLRQPLFVSKGWLGMVNDSETIPNVLLQQSDLLTISVRVSKLDCQPSQLTSFSVQTGLRTRSCLGFIKERKRPRRVDSAHFTCNFSRISL